MTETNAKSVHTNYSDSPVPEDQTTKGWRVAAVVISINVGLSTFLNGSQVASALGLWQAVLCAFLAGLILCAMGLLTSIASVKTRLNTYVLIQSSFGIKGAVIVNIMLALVHLGWFGVNASFFGSALLASLGDSAQSEWLFPVLVMVGSALMAITTIYGFKAINTLSLIAIPVVLAIFIAVFVISLQKVGLVTIDETPDNTMSFGIALSTLVGSNLLTVAAMPDISRFISTNKQAAIGMVLSFPIAIPFLVFLAAVPTLAMNNVDVMPIIKEFGLGVPALLMLVLSTWTANSLNLYSYSLSLSATFKKVGSYIFSIAGALVGGGLAVLGIIENFIPFLLVLGVIIPPVAAIYVIDCFSHGDSETTLRLSDNVQWERITVWLISSAISLATMYDVFTLTTAPAIDATLIAILLYLLVKTIKK